MTGQDARATAIAALGYTPREASFLASVTRHGGYFLRRQYLDWMGCPKGRAVVAFTHRLLTRRHATRHRFCRTTDVYHLASQGLYAGAPETTASDRRRRSVLAIKVRLMAFDFAATHPEIRFLATEAERLAYCDRLGLERTCLPQQVVRPYRSAEPSTRYFPEPTAFGLRDADGPAPTVVCAYLDDGARTLAGFATFLRHHARLLAAVPRWQVVYVGETRRQVTQATAAFHRAFGDLAGEPGGLARQEIVEFFRLRRLYERKAWAELQTAGLDRFLAMRAKVGVDLEALYAAWEVGGDDALESTERSSGEASVPRFEAVALPYRYLATEGTHARS